MYPDILSLIVHVGDDRSILNYDFYAITKKGYEELKKCENGENNHNCHCDWDPQ